MVLTVNIGNTHICIGGYLEDKKLFSAKLSSLPGLTADEYAIKLKALLSLYNHDPVDIQGCILASVVPSLTGQMLSGLRRLTSVRILTVGPGLKSGLAIRIDDPAQLGAELLCAAVGALKLTRPPLVLISADTAISMMAVNAAGQMVGGVILPGPQAALQGLVETAAQLPQIDLCAPGSVPGILGTNSASCLRAGSILGTASMLDGLVQRFRQALGQDTRAIATGSLPTRILENCSCGIEYHDGLILDGMYLIWCKNQK